MCERFPSLQALITHWHALEADPPDLVLVDLKLPDYQGLDAFAEVKVRAINIPVVALIDRSEAMLGPHLLQMGAADYLFRDALSAPLLEHVIQRAWERQRVQNNLSEYLQELYASEARFRTILQHYPDGLLILDAEGRILMANDEAQRLLGYAEAHLVGQPLEAFVREETPGFARLIGMSDPIRLQVIPCEEDDPCRLVLLRPLTESERQEMAASTAAQTLAEIILEVLDEAVLVADGEGRVVYANQAAAALMGKPHRQLTGRPLNGMLTTLMPGERFDRMMSWLELHGGIWQGIRRLESRSGSVQTFQVQLRLLSEPIFGMVILLRPVVGEVPIG
ncbi:PAS domain-containing protein [Rhodothermus marinus]|uniref:PAS domain-containing protein n=1 Tax=Rhodothermus marinus TaxID=29549 RepID=UPI001FB37D91|nr:PAS domain-containing protein [Rhodothermus marinus]